MRIAALGLALLALGLAQPDCLRAQSDTLTFLNGPEFTASGALGSGQRRDFHVFLPVYPAGWRLVLTSYGTADPDLYIQRGAMPSVTNYLKRSVDRAVDTIFLDDTEALVAEYYISIMIPSTEVGAAGFTLAGEFTPLTTLNWDPGSTPAPASVLTNQSAVGGDYYFKITTVGGGSGVWRTRLNVTSGEADLWLRQGKLPTPTQFDYASTQPGSDGMALIEGGQFKTNQIWYAMVTAMPGAKWSICSGSVYVTPLPPPAPDQRIETVIEPEGLNFYRTTIDDNTVAWRLGTGALTNNLYVRQGGVAHSFSASYYQWKQSGQMLLVPPYLKSGSEYFVTVAGKPGQWFMMDWGRQPIADLPFEGTADASATTYGYQTFRVQVPAEQIGWQVDLRVRGGAAGISIREAAVGNDYISTAFVAQTNAPLQTITLVPPTLRNASYYITVYGKPPFQAGLTSGRPLVTDVSYAFAITNDLPGWQGWRHYRVHDINQQLNSLAWELLLNQQPPGTEMALRRNAMPGQWAARSNYLQTATSTVTQYLDAWSTNSFLQRPRHQADVWYIGIRNTNQPLGSFVLTGREIARPQLALTADVVAHRVTDQQPAPFQFFQIDVPPELLGLELSLANVTQGEPRLVVSRGLLPMDLRTVLANGNSWTPYTATNWPIGAQIAATTDWTGFTSTAGGASENGRFWFAGRGNPLESGTYYVGVVSAPGKTNELSYELRVRGLFPNGSFTDLPLVGSSGSSGVAPHQAVWHRLTIPENTPSWKFRLDTTIGDAFIVFRQNGLPNYAAAAGSPMSLAGSKVRKITSEHFLLMPEQPGTSIPAGIYYLGVIEEGIDPTTSRAGSNTGSFVLSSEGPLDFAELGTVDPLGLTKLTAGQRQQGGETRGFHFTVPPNTPVLEVRLRDRINNPAMALRSDDQLPRLANSYGSSGGWTPTWSGNDLIRIPGPAPGLYTLLVQAGAVGSGGLTNATYTVEVSAPPAEALAFDNGHLSVTNQPPDEWKYYLATVPADALGWNLTLLNVTSGDPRMVISKDLIPFNVTTRTSTGGNWDPNTTTHWPSGWQVAPEKDWTGYSTSAAGTNETGRYFTASMGNPLEPGTYVIGITSSGLTRSSTNMTYEILSRGIGANMGLPVFPLALDGGQVETKLLEPHSVAFYRVDVPTNTPAWQLRLSPTLGEAMMVIRKDGLPNFGAAAATAVTNLAGCKLQKTGSEFFTLLPSQSSLEIPTGSYYLGVVSEGWTASGTRIGSNYCNYALASAAELGVTDLGEIDSFQRYEASENIVQEGGSVLAYQFEVVPGTLGVVARLENRVGNPLMTVRSGPILPRTLETYGRQGGWMEDFSSRDYIRITNSFLGGAYTLLVHAAAESGRFPQARYTLHVYSLVAGTIPLDFDGGEHSITGHLTSEWLYFDVNVPTNAIGWDLRLTGVTRGSPRLVICRSAYPVDLNSRLPNGSLWNWGTATNWPAGAQAAPGIDWTGYRFETNSFDTTGTIFAAGLNSPVEPGHYIIGVSSAPASTDAMTYTIRSRGIGPSFTIPVTPLERGDASISGSTLGPREAAYYSVDVPTNAPLWKWRLSPTAGEALLVARKDALPNTMAATNVLASSVAGGHKFQKSGAEHGLMGWPSGQTNLSPGTYYLAVVGEGNSPQPGKNMVGAGPSAFTLRTWVPSDVVDLGETAAAGNDLVVTNQLEPGETACYRFTLPPGGLSLTVGLEQVTGSARLRLRHDLAPPLDISSYGQDGGYRGTWEHTDRVLVLSPAAGTYTLSVLASNRGTNWSSLTYQLHIQVTGAPSQLDFDNGTAHIQNQADSWRLFTVSVPTNAIGWDLRLLNVSNGAPRLVVCRDKSPVNLSSHDELWQQARWPSGWQLAPTNDWTGLNETDGSPSAGRVFQAGMGNPLEPGTYYVGVTNLNSTNAASYTLLSRGIGAGFAVPVHELSFDGGTANEMLPAREAAWYRVDLPSDTPSWKVALNFDAGDGLLLAQRSFLPNLRATATNSITLVKGGKKMQKTGHEHLLFLGTGGSRTNLPGGTYYLGVVSEGASPNIGASRLGTGTSTFTLWSGGKLPPLDVGTVGPQDLLAQVALEAGETEIFTFMAAPGVPALELSLTNMLGYPAMTLAYGSYPPAAPLPYGSEGGVTGQWQSTNVITLANPLSTNFTLTLQATASALEFPDAKCELLIRSLPIPNLSFDPQVEGDGRSANVTGILQDGHKQYYRVQVPERVAGQPVIGWELDLSALYGTPAMRVRREALPDDSAKGVSIYFNRHAVFVPDYLAPGTWYVEVQATGLTEYTLSSRTLALTRPAWQMPARGKPVQTPGLPSAGPLFGDTAVATDGSSLPADQGIDLELDSLHYYAVAVPEGNGGLLRTMLAAISGNPNLYLRTHAPPTLSHNAVGGGAPLYDRALTNSVGSEYGNWVPLDSKTEFGLAPGLWYLAVHAAGGSHVRYRLQCSIGNISDLAFDGGRLDRQALLAGDWCYYRVQLPGTMPNRWTISFAKQQGDVAVYLRDAVPPGLGLSASNYVDWNQDRRNHGPYPFFTEAGSSTLSVPPVRPGAEYYLGVRAVSDGVFSIGSAAGTQLIPMDIIPFNGGSATRQIAPGESLLYRIEVPAGTQKWSHTSTHPSSVRCYLDQGTVPTFTTADHWFSTGPNSSLDARLVGSSWPWLAGYSYYLGVTNTSATTQSFSLRMAGQGLTARLGQAFIAPDGRIGFSITGASNLVFRVQFSPTLAPASWGDRSDYELSPGQAILLPILADQPAGFYRLRF